MDILLSFDVSSVKTGFSVIRNKRFRKTGKSWGTLDINKSLPLPEKLVYFRKRVIELLKKVKPTQVAIEDVFIGRFKSAVTLLKFNGVIIEAVRATMGYNPILLPATTVRRLLKCGKNKEDVYDYIISRYNINDWDFKTHNDITDAIALGLAILKGSKDGFVKEKVGRVRGKKQKS
jgi:Holliday junction resolvasome RuvABC endonuclease subunit